MRNAQCVEVKARKAWCFMRSLYVNSQAANGCVLREAFDILRCYQSFAICVNQHYNIELRPYAWSDCPTLPIRWFMMDVSTEIIRFLGAVEYILGGLTLLTSQNTIVTGEITRKAGNTRNACTTDEIETEKTTTIWEICHGYVFLSKQNGNSLFPVGDKVTLLR